MRPYGKHLLIQMHRDDGVDTVARLTEVDPHDVPYFAIVLVHGHGRRPEIAE